MKRISSILAGLSLAVLMVAACAPAAPSPTAAPPPKPADAPKAAPAKPAEAPAAKAAKPEDIQVPKPSGNLAFKVAYPSSIGFSHLSKVMTTERLNKQGWKVEDVFFSATELAAEATAKGETPLTSAASVTMLRAIEKGANVRMVAERVANEWTIASVANLKQCADLNGKRTAIHSQGSISTTMIRVWVEANCKGTNPDYIIIAGSDNRAIAILNKQIDASPLELSDWITVNSKQPGSFNLLVNFAQGLPDLAITPISVNVDWAEKNRDILVAYLAELIKTHRMIAATPKLLEDAATRLLPSVDAKALPEIVKAYQAINGFDGNGGLTQKRVEGTIKFFSDTKEIEPGMTAQKSADLKYLDEALKIVGRQ